MRWQQKLVINCWDNKENVESVSNYIKFTNRYF